MADMKVVDGYASDCDIVNEWGVYIDTADVDDVEDDVIVPESVPDQTHILLEDSDTEYNIQSSHTEGSLEHLSSWLSDVYKIDSSEKSKDMILDEEDEDEDDCIIVEDTVSPVSEDGVTINEPDLGYYEGDDISLAGVEATMDNYGAITSTDEFTTGSSVSPKTKTKPCAPSNRLDRKYYCSECRAVFSEEHEHETKVESVKAKTYNCPACDGTFISAQVYSRHCRSCSKRCTCQLCGTLFKDVCLLRKHIITVHTAESVDDTSDRPASTSMSFTTTQQKPLNQNASPSSTRSQANTAILRPISSRIRLSRPGSQEKSTLSSEIHQDARHANLSNTSVSRPMSSRIRVSRPVKDVNCTASSAAWSEEDEKWKIYTCSSCLLTFTSCTSYSNHCRFCKVRCTCQICGKVCIDIGMLRKHITLVHTAETPENTPNKRPSSSRVSHQNIKSTVESENQNRNRTVRKDSQPLRKFPCLECDRVLYSLGNLHKHQQSHKSPKKSLSSVSRNNHRDYKDISTKKRKQAELPSKKFKCAECGLALSCLQNLKRHKRTHDTFLNEIASSSKKSPKMSTILGSSVADKAVKDWTTGRFKCDDCGRIFIYLFNLQRHLSTHSKNTPFQCQVCYARFSKLTHLKNHFSNFHIK